MRTIVDIPDDQIAALAQICSRAAISRTEAIRQAIAVYAEQHTAIPSFADACGRWQDRKLDGRAYQETLRQEWDTPCGPFSTPPSQLTALRA
jgi:hypothetical protein